MNKKQKCEHCGYKHLDAVFCEHANEMPSGCPCGPDCYCKFHSCWQRDYSLNSGRTRSGSAHRRAAATSTRVTPSIASDDSDEREDSLARNRDEIEQWLSNVTRLKAEVETREDMPIDLVRALLKSLDETGVWDSAFLTRDGTALCVTVGRVDGRGKPDRNGRMHRRTFRFTK